MIVLLDTTVFGADALCGGDAWQTLVLAAPIWGVRIAVTEVVITEAVANYQREVNTARTGLRGWADKRLGALGLWEAFNSADDVLTDGAANYESRLRERLEAAGVEILPIAEIPHIELVKRASARRRPCDDKGDGYRDTLNWLTLLALAKAEGQEQIIWVSGNTKDFGSNDQDGGADFHPHLVEDLESISALDRVFWKSTLADVVLTLAAEHSPGSESDIKQVQEKVRNASVLEFLVKELLPSAIQQPVSPRQCALPLETISAKFRSLEGIRNLELTLKGVVPGKRAVAEFTVEADAGIDATLVYPADSGNDAATSTLYINKPLLLRGLVTLGKFENPVGAELAGIEALPDDPGRSEWKAYHPGYSFDREAFRRMAEAMRPLQQNQETLRRMAEIMRPLQQNQETLRRMAEIMRPLQQNQETLRRMAEIMRPLLQNQEAIRRLINAADDPASSGDSAEPESGDDHDQEDGNGEEEKGEREE